MSLSKIDPSCFKWFIGYARIPGYKATFKTVDNYDAIMSDTFANMADDCFDWIELKDNYYSKLEDTDKTSSALVLDYKVRMDVNRIKRNILANISVQELRKMLTDNNTQSMDFNIILHPVLRTGMQFEDLLTIVKPVGMLKTKLLKEVLFEVKRSLVKNAQKVFQILFYDNTTNELIYSDSSIENASRFQITTNTGIVTLQELNPDNSIFEQLSDIEYPESKFIVTYTLPADLVKYLAEHLDYKITIRLTDLTSERRSS